MSTATSDAEPTPSGGSVPMIAATCAHLLRGPKQVPYWSRATLPRERAPSAGSRCSQPSAGTREFRCGF
eukprot:5221945-Pyramimonas_sp.AAC.1